MYPASLSFSVPLAHSTLISFIVIHIFLVDDLFTAPSAALNNAFAAQSAGHDGCIDSPSLHLHEARPFPQSGSTRSQIPHTSTTSTRCCSFLEPTRLPLLNRSGLPALVPRSPFAQLHLLTAPQCQSTGSSRVCVSRVHRRSLSMPTTENLSTSECAQCLT